MPKAVGDKFNQLFNFQIIVVFVSCWWLYAIDVKNIDLQVKNLKNMFFSLL